MRFPMDALRRARGSEAVERLLAQRRPRNAYEYQNAIGAFGRARDWGRAVALLGEMTAAGVAPNKYCFGAAISACEKGGQWERAVALLGEMRTAGVPPNVVAFNAAISACGKAGEWERALSLLHEYVAAHS